MTDRELPLLPRDPPIHSYWRHRKARGDYCVEGVAYLEKTLEVVVIYRHIASSLLWVRPHSEFMDGRFERVSS